MSLIKCVDCGKEISSEAASCLYCGRPHDSIVEYTRLRKSFLGVAIVAFQIFVGIVFLIMGLASLALRSYFGIIFSACMLFFIFRWLNKMKRVNKK